MTLKRIGKKKKVQFFVVVFFLQMQDFSSYVKSKKSKFCGAMLIITLFIYLFVFIECGVNMILLVSQFGL